MTVLGTAIHACVAMSCTDTSQALTVSDVERVLIAFGVSDCISGAGVLRQVGALHDWIRARWPGAFLSAEYPVQSVLDSGQVLSGRLDLLLQTTDGWILIDHKSTQLAPDHWEQLASEYGAQLAAYANAIEKASGRPVLESWLFLPVAAGALKLELR
jgi:hypothetical protein